MTDQLICNALDMALDNRCFNHGLIVHSDRDVQYRSNKFIENGCKISRSHRAGFWDNAAMESFFSRLKVELIYPKRFNTISQTRVTILSILKYFTTENAGIHT